MTDSIRHLKSAAEEMTKAAETLCALASAFHSEASEDSRTVRDGEIVPFASELVRLRVHKMRQVAHSLRNQAAIVKATAQRMENDPCSTDGRALVTRAATRVGEAGLQPAVDPSAAAGVEPGHGSNLPQQAGRLCATCGFIRSNVQCCCLPAKPNCPSFAAGHIAPFFATPEEKAAVENQMFATIDKAATQGPTDVDFLLAHLEDIGSDVHFMVGPTPSGGLNISHKVNCPGCRAMAVVRGFDAAGDSDAVLGGPALAEPAALKAFFERNKEALIRMAANHPEDCECYICAKTHDKDCRCSGCNENAQARADDFMDARINDRGV